MCASRICIQQLHCISFSSAPALRYMRCPCARSVTDERHTDRRMFVYLGGILGLCLCTTASQRLHSPHSHCKQNRAINFWRCQKVVFHDCFPNSRWHRSADTDRVVDTIFFVAFIRFFHTFYDVLISIIWSFLLLSISPMFHFTPDKNQTDCTIADWTEFPLKICFELKCLC